MDIRQLRYFATIVEEGQITRAAKKLHMAQPPLSQQLKALEEELSTLLVVRNGKNIELTAAGKVLYKRATNLLSQIDETIMEVKEVGEGLKGTLSIGSVKTCFSHLPERIRFFREKYSNVTFRLYEGDTYRLLQDLRNRHIEVAIVRLPLESESDDLSSLPLPPDHFVAVIPETWNYENTLKLDELSSMPLMLLQRFKGVGQYELVIEACRKYHYEPNIVCQCSDADMIMSLVREGVGASLLPRSVLSSFSMNGLKILELEELSIQSDSAVIWLKDRYLSKSAIKFIETFKREYNLNISQVE
ncbi:LysR family transcriptional regulator [Lysinibacillus sp. NPDC056185]|uniref:LysR family transcriptional regulator n=1 Tax=Lysinibacillus sp. NPDC056185 TaxID=3345739 RepID=UPI0039F015DA